ncbi:hypothetical protein I6L27_02005 [Acinetobacter pittii]|uniref:hypothetical protein n=1 Tax=Acinetobacter calcoaceticus/baumannii complex TaxID=909768 RepID=UPI001C234505|nr:hypothetical protein [Acinetobacter pittii]QXA08339.1 hypothetical protein I6L27_02005 [Acinetobacter pittii]
MKKLWAYGTTFPLQRIGLIILLLGIVSFISWCIESRIVFWIDAYSGWATYYYPENYEYFFYKLHPFFIPLGLLMTWLLIPSKKIYQFVSNWVFKNN